MNPMSQRSRMYGAIIVLSLLLLTFGLGSCAIQRGGIQVIPKGSSGGVLDLSADDVVTIMQRAGFSNEQIYEHGMAVRDGLAQSGAVLIKMGKKIEAIFFISGEDIRISTLSRGYFVYNINRGWLSVDRSIK